MKYEEPILNQNDGYVLRIGGEFGLESGDFLSTGIALPAARGRLDKSHYLDFDTGRSALYAALQDILARGGKKTAWLPAYTCDSVILPFQQSGFDIRFYSVGCNLQSPAGLPHELDQETFLFIHYFGLINRPIVEWLSEMKRSYRFFAIEDCVQALLTDGAGQYGDYAVKSYRKFLPLPDGAILGSKVPLVDVNRAQPDEGFISRRLAAQLLRPHRPDDPIVTELFKEAENIINGPIIPRHMSWVSRHLLQKIDFSAVSLQRRSNWAELKKLLAALLPEDFALRRLFRGLGDGETPLGMPVIIGHGQRDMLRQHLASKNIFCPVHWPLHPAICEDKGLRGEIELSESVLTLPIDQRISLQHLEYMCKQIRAFYFRGKHGRE